MEGYFKRLNTLLLFVLIIFGAFLALSINKANSQKAVSAEEMFNDLGVDPNGNVTVIDKRFDVQLVKKYNADGSPTTLNSFKVDFVSDGVNSSSGDIEEFSKLGVPPIPIPLRFTITDAHIDAPGTPIYKNIRKMTAATGTPCDDKVRDDCLYKAMATVAWQNGIMLQVEGKNVEDLKKYVNINPDSDGLRRWSSIMNSLNILQLVKPIFTDSNSPDTQRISIGSGSYWADDELQQIARTNGKLIEPVTFEVKGSEVTRSVEYSIQQFAANLPSSIAKKVGFSNLSARADTTGLKGREISLIPDYDQKRDDVIPDTNLVSGILALLFPPKAQEQRRLGVHVPLRKVEQADSFGASYSFCEATKELGVGSTGFKNDDLPNPFPERTRPIPGALPDPITGEVPREPDPDDDQSKFDRQSGETRRCVDAVMKYQGNENAMSCARALVSGGGCNEFSIEEEDLNFSRVEQGDIAISMGAYIRNSVFTDLNPDFKGPFVNYLAPRFCAQLIINYDIKPEKSYIYRAGGGASGSEGNYDNQYCVVGAVLSNYSWVMHEQNRYFSSTDYTHKINMFKDALTCDKKEQANFGATQVYSDNPAPSDKLVYKVQDNIVDGKKGGHGRLSPESVMIYHGNDPISLRDIIDEFNCVKFEDDSNTCIMRYSTELSIFTYTESDVRVIVGDNARPKYVMLVTQKVDEENKESDNPRRTLLCRVDYQFGGAQPVKGSKLCKELERGGKVFLTGRPTLTKKNGKDYITYVNYKTDDSKTLEVRFVDVNAEDISKSSVYPDPSQKALSLSSSQLFDYKVKNLGVRNQVAVLGTRVKGSLTEVSLILVDPVNHKLISQNNLCDGINKSLGYCLMFEDLPVTTKLVYDPTGDKLFAIVLGGYAGLVLTPNIDGTLPPARLFAFNKTTKIASAQSNEQANEEQQKEIDKSLEDSSELSDAEKEILKQKIDPGSDEVSTLNDAQFDANTNTLYLFVSSKIASYMLRLNEASRWGIEDKVNTICQGYNCLVTTQKEFNPATFTWDCSDYFGTGVCGAKKMSKVGYPQVIHSVIHPNGKISAWYTYSGMSRSHVIFYSDDYEYALNGVYARLGADVNAKEYTNVYLPVKTTGGAGGRGRPVDKVGLTWISNPMGKILRDVHVKVVNGVVSELINSRMNPEKKDCLDILNTQVEDDDDFYKIPGVQKPFFTTYTPGSNTNPDGNSPFNPSGKYCEETWCVPDNFSLVNNRRFKTQASGGDMTQAEYDSMKTSVTDWLKKRYAGKEITGDQCKEATRQGIPCTYQDAVNRICNAAQAAGMPCQVLIGIWVQESSSALVTGQGSFNCFLDGADTFDKQISCAVNSLVNGAAQYDGTRPGGLTLSGPGSVFTPNQRGDTKEGQCETATRFSMMFERYTPIDKHRNFNNQCNRGLVVREDNNYNSKDAINKCLNDNRAIGSSSKNDGTVAWPQGNLVGAGTRPNLRLGIEEINKLLPQGLQIPITNSCYKGNGTDTGGGGGATKPQASDDIYKDFVVKRADGTLCTKGLDAGCVGVFKMNLGAWGKGEAAANVRMALDGNINGNGAPGIEGLHEIKPGGFFSFNDTIGNPLTLSQSTIDKYVALGYRFDDPNLIIGGGWCELATTIRVAAGRVNDPFSTFKRFNYQKFESLSALGPNPGPGYGTGKGYMGDIRNFQHSLGNGQPLDVSKFNNKLAVNGDNLTDNYSYVSIMTSFNSKGWGDGDLELSNSSATDNLYINVRVDNYNVVTAEVFFGQKKGSPTTLNTDPGINAVSKETKAISSINTSSVIVDRRKIIG